MPEMIPGLEGAGGGRGGRGAAKRTGRRNPPSSEPVPVTWREIHADGTERDRAGTGWAVAPRWRDQPAEWVRTDDEDPPRLEMVITAQRRHRSRSGDWSAGRYVDKGERYTDPVTRLTVAYWGGRSRPTSIPTPELPEWVFRALSGDYWREVGS